MAINFKLGPVRALNEGEQASDPMRRSWIGWDPERSPEEHFEANRGMWVLGRRAHAERYATFSVDGEIRLVAEIDEVQTLPWRFGEGRDKQVIMGRLLPEGDPVFEAFVAQGADQHRNPVTHGRDPGAEGRVCACGCGTPVPLRSAFAPGHDQRAVHDRIARRWGNTVEFLRWFDAEHTELVSEPGARAA